VAAAAFVLVISLLGIASPAAAANRYVSGPIVGDTVWSAADTWIMTGNVTVRPGVTLTIEPGTAVKANFRVRLYVEGTLIADGAPGNLITFTPNSTATNIPWGGVQFNKSSEGSVSWASFSRAEQSIIATQSSPWISDNVIDSSFTGIVLDRSSSTVSQNQINYTNVAIQAMAGGDVVLSGNTITNVTGNPALGIYVTNLQSVQMWSNTIQGLAGQDGRTPGLPGGRGSDGAYAVGILVNATSSVILDGNQISQVVGGRGGNGAASGTGTGGRGGDGGPTAGIVTFSVDSLEILSTTVTSIVGGRGGNGGASSAASGNGGEGGTGGSAAAIESVEASTSAVWTANYVFSIAAGSGGDGGPSSFGTIGNGGTGSDAYAFLTGQAMNGEANWNTVQLIRGGFGGNSSNAARGGSGGNAGLAAGFWAFGVDGISAIHDNFMTDLRGGGGGAGRVAAGAGGDATGMLVVGDGSPFNLSTVQLNMMSSLTGGTGGVGTFGGGAGGSVTGFAALHVTLNSSWNTMDSLIGGKGGDAVFPANPAGRGGDSTAFVAALLPAATSSSDTIQTVTKGAPGAGAGTPTSYGVGLFAIGNATVRTSLTIWNGTLSGISDLDLHVNNYTEATTVNTPFSSSKLAVQNAGNLTVRNFLSVAAYWPNNITPVSGSSVLVTDDGAVAWDVPMPFGFADWLLVTDRVYVQSTTTIHDNRTDVTVSYPSSLFWDNPRSVDMATGHAESFGMIDAIPPTSSASPVPPYESSLTFFVGYTYDDGNGTGVESVSLWYRAGGAGAWTFYDSQTVPSPGGFSFTATADGTYEFYTVATDAAGNAEIAPATNDTWTIVDTVRPGSHVQELGTYQTSLSFLVSWAPDPSVTDIQTYTVQYNSGSGWKNWLVNTDATSGTFFAISQGVHGFRSIATDAAGNTEFEPATNDTWTIVDVVAPNTSVGLSGTNGLNGWYRSGVTVTLSASDETSGVASISYRIDGGVWQTYAAPFVVGGDGSHDVEYFATDRAGLVETTKTSPMQIDTTSPFGAAGSPNAGNTDPHNSISITFSEAMDHASVEQAFSTIPSVTGAFAWSSDSRNLVFQPDSPLAAGQGYTVLVESSAHDVAGNPMSGPYTFSFTTASAGFGGSILADGWWIFLLVAIAAATAIFLMWQRRRGGLTPKTTPVSAPPVRSQESAAILEDVFLLYHRDGVLIKHETRRLRPDVDTDILSGMLTAVQQFVKDALRGDDYAELNEMTVGHMHILIGRGKWLVLATRIEGDGTQSWTGQIERCIKDMEDHHWDQLEDWDGDMAIARVLMPYLKKLIQGGYALVDA
jgi:hypothetical protein